MKKQYKNVILCLCSVAAVLLAGLVVTYFIGTSSFGQMKEYCLENTQTGATEFEVCGIDKMGDYRFWVSESKNDPMQQELYIVRLESLFGIFDLQRYVLVDHQVSSAGQAVGKTVLTLDEKQEAVIFFSSNPNNISYYDIEFQENGKFGTLRGGVTSEDSFVVGILGIGSGEYLYRRYDAAIFYDVGNNIVETHGRRVRENE